MIRRYCSVCLEVQTLIWALERVSDIPDIQLHNTTEKLLVSAVTMKFKTFFWCCAHKERQRKPFKRNDSKGNNLLLFSGNTFFGRGVVLRLCIVFWDISSERHSILNSHLIQCSQNLFQINAKKDQKTNNSWIQTNFKFF